MTGGYYLMHRGWMKCRALRMPVFCQGLAWVDLIERAAFKAHRINYKGRWVFLQRGQLAASLRELAAAWGWDEARVRRFLSRLKTDAMIDAATDAGVTVITLCNYDRFQIQPDEADAPGDAQSDALATQYRRSRDAQKKEGNTGNQEKEGNQNPRPFGAREDSLGSRSGKRRSHRKREAERDRNAKILEDLRNGR